MNTIKDYKHPRKAISPIIATVLIIAVTLVASVAIGGFVFGLFGSATSTAQVQATVATITSTVNSGSSSLSVNCQATAPTNNYVALYNSGTAATTISLVSLTVAGTTMSVAPTGSCSVTPGITVYVSIGQIAATAAAVAKGLQFTGYAATSNGAQVVFAGAFA